MRIPYLNISDEPISASSQDFVPIADIVGNMIVYKDGGAAIVLESTSLNFELLSEKEQQAIIAAYAALLNSLAYPVQIVVRSQRKDISSYMRFLQEESQKGITNNPQLVKIMQGYRRFILEAIKKKNVLSKKFYIVIPFTQYELGVTKSFLSLTRRRGPLPFPRSYVIKKAKVALIPKRDHLIRQAGRLGIRLRQLTKPELVELFFGLFNPEPPATIEEKQKEEEETKE